MIIKQRKCQNHSKNDMEIVTINPRQLPPFNPAHRHLCCASWRTHAALQRDGFRDIQLRQKAREIEDARAQRNGYDSG